METSTNVILSSCPFKGGVSQYREVMQRWHEFPHYVNRRLSGATILFCGKINHPQDVDTVQKFIVQTNLNSSMDVEELVNSIKLSGINLEECSSFSSDFGLVLSVKKLLPRNIQVFSSMIEIAIFDYIFNNTIFMGLPSIKQDTGISLSPVLSYSISFYEDEIKLAVFDNSVSDHKSVAWLRDTLLPKLQRWSEEPQEKCFLNIKSLSLVSVERYTQLYQELKMKYGRKMVEIWPENTDPLKFVYEDVAIATYLLLLWEIQRDQCKRQWRQSFVDLGCGNGLLVYILNSEGHDGIGIDVRKRKIWDLYPESTKLKVETFDPSNCSLFPETDWIIGNHSDELTPWIPVITTRSSYKCNFFLLPCCSYEFSGCKYKRMDSSRSQYSDYLNYIKSVCQLCGFKVHLDRLKIPSTKRICLVSFERDYSEDCLKEKEAEILKFIETRNRETDNFSSQIKCDGNPSLEKQSEVKLRDSVEKVRNCTQLPKDLINKIIQEVVKHLLGEENRIPIENERGDQVMWNSGGCMNICDIVTSLPQGLLNELKKECGGLQTLLKNNRHIFFVAKGKVKLAASTKMHEKKDISKNNFSSNKKGMKFQFKQKPCWFYEFHPDGCPFKNEVCTFRH